MRLRFKEHKNELKMTWEQYLEDTDVSPNTMMTWLRGANHPSVISVEIIAYKHKVNPAWLDGYEVEREKLYTVEIPNGQPFVRGKESGIVYVSQDLAATPATLTEAEIRKDFEWAWQAGFAKEVE